MRRIIGRLSIYLFGIIIAWSTVSAFSFDDVKEFPYEPWEEYVNTEDTVDAWQVFKDESVNNEEWIVIQLMDAFGINYTDETDQTATFYIKELINWLLAIVGIVALISLLWWFYKMLLSKDSEEWYTSAKKIVMNAAIAITVIWLSWFIVSWFFAIYSATLSTTWGV